MLHDVMPPVPRLENQECVGGWTVCGFGDPECSAKAGASGLRFVERHGGVGYYCAPAATHGSISGFGWLLLVGVFALVGLMTRRFIRRRRARGSSDSVSSH
jgi:hypothetical protein